MVDDRPRHHYPREDPRYTAPVTVLFPRRAISVISAPGQPFHDLAADTALLTALRTHLRTHLRPDILFCDHDTEINDPLFARACAEALLAHLTKHAV